MNFLYSLIHSIAFVVMLPVFFLRWEKYSAGFRQRLGSYPKSIDTRRSIWLHCVSVGEVNAARPLIEEILRTFTAHRLVISTTTKTGQELAQNIFGEKASVVYFPFDFKFSVRKALQAFCPSLVLLMETEIWPRFVTEAKLSGASVAIVNGRLSQRSAKRYSYIKPFIHRVLDHIDLALMQAEPDAERIVRLGMKSANTQVTGNLKFDLILEDSTLAETLSERFAITKERPLIIAASTHEPEEEWLIEAFAEFFLEPSTVRPRLMIAPRHPERFNRVVDIVSSLGTGKFLQFPKLLLARRSANGQPNDTEADIILLDSIGELRYVFELAEIVFVGGSLIPHGGQSILEPAAAGKAIITGPFTHNFADAVRVFLANNALIQVSENRPENVVDELFLELSDLLEEPEERERLGANAVAVMKANRGATTKTLRSLADLFKI
jgi:3-deoxy-D-manno-octulosonic-acid transferase